MYAARCWCWIEPMCFRRFRVQTRNRRQVRHRATAKQFSVDYSADTYFGFTVTDRRKCYTIVPACSEPSKSKVTQVGGDNNWQSWFTKRQLSKFCQCQKKSRPLSKLRVTSPTLRSGHTLPIANFRIKILSSCAHSVRLNGPTLWAYTRLSREGIWHRSRLIFGMDHMQRCTVITLPKSINPDRTNAQRIGTRKRLFHQQADKDTSGLASPHTLF